MSATNVMSLEKKVLDKEQFLEAGRRLPTALVEVPEWDGYVMVRGLTAQERDEYEESLLREVDGQYVPDTRGARARLVMLGVVDEEGRRLFYEQDLPTLQQMEGRVLGRLAEKIAELSGIGAGVAKDLAKNSSTTHADDSASG